MTEFSRIPLLGNPSPQSNAHEPSDAGNGMGIYSKYVFPWLCDWALDQPLVANHRRELLEQVHGEVLEIGVGTGLNLPCYPATLRKLTVVEPNPGMRKRLLRRIQQTDLQVEQHSHVSEQLPFSAGQFDYVVSTFTMCSIRGLDKALQAVHRVLKTGGKFVFLEHGLCPKPEVQKRQRQLNWLQGYFGDGCRLDLDFRQQLSTTPFGFVEMKNYYLEKTPETHGYLYQGSAEK